MANLNLASLEIQSGLRPVDESAARELVQNMDQVVEVALFRHYPDGSQTKIIVWDRECGSHLLTKFIFQDHELRGEWDPKMGSFFQVSPNVNVPVNPPVNPAAVLRESAQSWPTPPPGDAPVGWTHKRVEEVTNENKQLRADLRGLDNASHELRRRAQQAESKIRDLEHVRDELKAESSKWFSRAEQQEKEIKHLRSAVSRDLREHFQKFQKMCFDQSTKSGFHEDADSVPMAYYASTKLMLIVSEAAEAMEELRKPGADGYVNFDNLGEELADIVIRVFDLAGLIHIDLAASLEYKMEKNANRPYKHGGKAI